MANIDTDIILANIDQGDYVIANIPKDKVAYIRCWANRKGLHISIDGPNAIVSKEKYNKLRTEIYRNLPKGQMFLVIVPPASRQYLRNLISIYNKTAETKYRTSRVTNPPGSNQYIIYPDPVQQLKQENEKKLRPE
jgi:hypothetical protein